MLDNVFIDDEIIESGRNVFFLLMNNENCLDGVLQQRIQAWHRNKIYTYSETEREN